MSLSLYLEQALELSTDETHIVEELFIPLIFNKGDIIISPIQKNIPMYFITDGYVRVYAIQDGKEVTQWIGSPNYFMTDLTAWLFNTPIKWTIEALTPVSTLAITKSDYNKLSTQIEQWNEKERAFIGHCFEQMENRIFQFISLNAEQRYMAFFNQLGHLFNEVPHQYIASMLGMTPETLSRIRKKTV